MSTELRLGTAPYEEVNVRKEFPEPVASVLRLDLWSGDLDCAEQYLSFTLTRIAASELMKQLSSFVEP